jgi:hypothetical protein
MNCQYNRKLVLACGLITLPSRRTFDRRLKTISIDIKERISIEPLIEHIKSVFRIDPLPAYGFHTVYAIVLLSVLLYQLMVYYNCEKNTSNPKSIKYMLGTW